MSALLDRIDKSGEDSEFISDADLEQLISYASECEEALMLIKRGLERGKIPDQSLLRWKGCEDLTSLSKIVAAALDGGK